MPVFVVVCFSKIRNQQINVIDNVSIRPMCGLFNILKTVKIYIDKYFRCYEVGNHMAQNILKTTYCIIVNLN